MTDAEPLAADPVSPDQLRAEARMQLIAEVHALLLAHGARWHHYTTFSSSDPAVVFRLAEPGALPSYFDAQRQPLKRSHDGAREYIHARWRDALLTWPAETA